MKYLDISNKSLLAAIAALALGSGPVSAAEADTNLLMIMRTLNADTLRLTEAMMVEDWETMAETAEAIANHPKAPMGERMKILSHLGARAGEFRRHDVAVHDAAVALAEASANRDMATASAQFGVLVTGCTACHDAFRPEIRDLRLNAAAADAED